MVSRRQIVVATITCMAETMISFTNWKPLRNNCFKYKNVETGHNSFFNRHLWISVTIQDFSCLHWELPLISWFLVWKLLVLPSTVGSTLRKRFQIRTSTAHYEFCKTTKDRMTSKSRGNKSSLLSQLERDPSFKIFYNFFLLARWSQLIHLFWLFVDFSKRWWGKIRILC